MAGLTLWRADTQGSGLLASNSMFSITPGGVQLAQKAWKLCNSKEQMAPVRQPPPCTSTHIHAWTHKPLGKTRRSCPLQSGLPAETLLPAGLVFLSRDTHPRRSLQFLWHGSCAQTAAKSGGCLRWFRTNLAPGSWRDPGSPSLKGRQASAMLTFEAADLPCHWLWAGLWLIAPGT